MYFNSISKFWHPEEQMQQIRFLIGKISVTSDGKLLLEAAARTHYLKESRA